MKKYILFILLVTTLSIARSQNSTAQKPCSSPEAAQFDFWVGEWDLTWNDTSHGTNRVQKIMDGCAVNENFFDPAINYSGSSWSVYSPRIKLWHQTWVDNQGWIYCFVW